MMLNRITASQLWTRTQLVEEIGALVYVFRKNNVYKTLVIWLSTSIAQIGCPSVWWETGEVNWICNCAIEVPDGERQMEVQNQG